MTRVRLLFIVLLVVSAAIVVLGLHDRATGRFTPITLSVPAIADGWTTVELQARPEGRSLRANTLKAKVLDGEHRASVESVGFADGIVKVRVRPGVLPGKIRVRLEAESFAPSVLELDSVALTTDSHNDGTPDFLRLDQESESAFRSWFSYLAEVQYFRPSSRLAREIDDCAALLRFAFRESLRGHDSTWANNLDLDSLKAFPDVRKYNYPYTPAAASLFRVRPGTFEISDLKDGAFAEFADAQTLQRLNTHLVSRDVRSARPGDLFFYRQLDQDMPFHAMVFVGPSHFDNNGVDRVVYHTGPIGDSSGEIRRPSLDELLNHPQPQWRPLTSNRNFLGVYRWNILR